MSPEQVREASDVDARADVWSLGVTLYQLVTARLPFEAYTTAGVPADHRRRSGAAGRPTRRSSIPRSAVILRCLAKKLEGGPEHRGSFAAALAPFAGDAARGAALSRASRARSRTPSSSSIPTPSGAGGRDRPGAIRPRSASATRRACRGGVTADDERCADGDRRRQHSALRGLRRRQQTNARRAAFVAGVPRWQGSVRWRRRDYPVGGEGQAVPCAAVEPGSLVEALHDVVSASIAATPTTTLATTTAIASALAATSAALRRERRRPRKQRQLAHTAPPTPPRRTSARVDAGGNNDERDATARRARWSPGRPRRRSTATGWPISAPASDVHSRVKSGWRSLSRVNRPRRRSPDAPCYPGILHARSHLPEAATRALLPAPRPGRQRRAAAAVRGERSRARGARGPPAGTPTPRPRRRRSRRRERRREGRRGRRDADRRRG